MTLPDISRENNNLKSPRTRYFGTWGEEFFYTSLRTLHNLELITYHMDSSMTSFGLLDFLG